MAKQTSSRTTASGPKSKPSAPPEPITKTVAKPSERALPASQPAPSREAIAQRAYELYQRRAPHEGNADNDWLRAERELAS